MPVGALGNRTPTWPGDLFHFTQSELEGPLVDVIEDEAGLGSNRGGKWASRSLTQ